MAQSLQDSALLLEAHYESLGEVALQHPVRRDPVVGDAVIVGDGVSILQGGQARLAELVAGFPSP